VVSCNRRDVKSESRIDDIERIIRARYKVSITRKKKKKQRSKKPQIVGMSKVQLFRTIFSGWLFMEHPPAAYWILS